jgi:hypothetical protein
MLNGRNLQQNDDALEVKWHIDVAHCSTSHLKRKEDFDCARQLTVNGQM